MTLDSVQRWSAEMCFQKAMTAKARGTVRHQGEMAAKRLMKHYPTAAGTLYGKAKVHRACEALHHDKIEGQDRDERLSNFKTILTEQIPVPSVVRMDQTRIELTLIVKTKQDSPIAIVDRAFFARKEQDEWSYLTPSVHSAQLPTSGGLKLFNLITFETFLAELWRNGASGTFVDLEQFAQRIIDNGEDIAGMRLETEAKQVLCGALTAARALRLLADLKYLYVGDSENALEDLKEVMWRSTTLII